MLEPIFILLLTGLAFAVLGLALEHILNPRVISDVPVAASGPGTVKTVGGRSRVTLSVRGKRALAGLMLAVVMVVIFVPTGQGKTLASIFMNYLDPPRMVDTRIKNPEAMTTEMPVPFPLFPSRLRLLSLLSLYLRLHHLLLRPQALPSR